MKKYLISTFFLLSTFIYAQVGIGTTTPNADAALDINGASGGLLLPRVALTSTTSPTPHTMNVEGMTVYNTTTVADVSPGIYYNNGTVWIKLDTTLGNYWGLNGNSGTVSGVNFIGTTDDQAVDFRTNNSVRARLTSKGQLELINPEESVFVGEQSGTNSTNVKNVGIGYKTINNGNGKYNVAIGNNTMTRTNGGSDYNVAVGYLAMEKNLNGADFNTAFGYSALRELVGGDGNTAIGHLAQADLTTGSNNTSLGYHALRYNLSGNKNVAIGQGALSTNESGNNNIAIGFWAGYFQTGSNKLYIETTDASSPLIGGDFLNDRAGINYDINSLTHTLNVGGSIKIDTFLNLAPMNSAPSTPSEGDIYYNATLKKVQVYNGAIWESLN